MRQLFKMMLALVMSGLALSSCSGGENYGWNQKLTVTVNTPDGLKTGSAVTHVDVTVYDTPPPMTSTERTFSTKGEATVVDLGNGKYLFALLSHSGANATEYLAENTFYFSAGPEPKTISGSGNAFWGPIYKGIQSKQVAALIPPKHLPMLVTFTDTNDPKSVKEVTPGELSDVFGAGYSLKSITLEITDEKVTGGGSIERILRWLDQYDNTLLDGSRYPDAQNSNISNHISSGSFRREQ